MRRAEQVAAIAALVLAAACGAPETPAEESVAVADPAPWDGRLDTAAWTTYRNEAAGYEIRHPADWAVIEAAPRRDSDAVEADRVLLGPEGPLSAEAQKATFVEPGDGPWPGRFQVQVIDNPGRRPLEVWAAAFGLGPAVDAPGETDDAVVERLPAALGRRPAVEMLVFGFDQHESVVAAALGERIVLVTQTASTPNDPNLPRHLEICAEMRRSFRFLR